MAKPKFKWKVVGIDRDDSSCKAVAKKLEKTLSKLSAQGYDIKVHDLADKGFAVVGRRELQGPSGAPRQKTFTADSPSELMRMLGAQAMTLPTPGQYLAKGKKTSEFLDMIMGAMDRIPPHEYDKYIETQVRRNLGHENAEELKLIADDCEGFAVQHLKEQGEGCCEIPKVLRKVKDAVLAKLKYHVS